ncbi:hypothetical protein Droror1_Dr00006534 [Drosera rotundifolia]
MLSLHHSPQQLSLSLHHSPKPPTTTTHSPQPQPTFTFGDHHPQPPSNPSHHSPPLTTTLHHVSPVEFVFKLGNPAISTRHARSRFLGFDLSFWVFVFASSSLSSPPRHLRLRGLEIKFGSNWELICRRLVDGRKGRERCDGDDDGGRRRWWCGEVAEVVAAMVVVRLVVVRRLPGQRPWKPQTREEEGASQLLVNHSI